MSFWDPDFMDEMRRIDDVNRNESFQLRQVIEPLCRKHGYGRVMQLVSEWWRERDPIGAIAMGETYGMLALKAKKKAKRKAPR